MNAIELIIFQRQLEEGKLAYLYLRKIWVLGSLNEQYCC